MAKIALVTFAQQEHARESICFWRRVLEFRRHGLEFTTNEYHQRTRVTTATPETQSQLHEPASTSAAAAAITAATTTDGGSGIVGVMSTTSPTTIEAQQQLLVSLIDANEIYDEYIVPGSANQIDIRDTMREQIRDTLSRIAARAEMSGNHHFIAFKGGLQPQSRPGKELTSSSSSSSSSLPMKSIVRDGITISSALPMDEANALAIEVYAAFNGAHQWIINVLEATTFPRFIASQSFQSLLATFNGITIDGRSIPQPSHQTHQNPHINAIWPVNNTGHQPNAKGHQQVDGIQQGPVKSTSNPKTTIQGGGDLMKNDDLKFKPSPTLTLRDRLNTPVAGGLASDIGSENGEGDRDLMAGFRAPLSPSHNGHQNVRVNTSSMSMGGTPQRLNHNDSSSALIFGNVHLPPLSTSLVPPSPLAARGTLTGAGGQASSASTTPMGSGTLSRRTLMPLVTRMGSLGGNGNHSVMMAHAAANGMPGLNMGLVGVNGTSHSSGILSSSGATRMIHSLSAVGSSGMSPRDLDFGGYPSPHRPGIDMSNNSSQNGSHGTSSRNGKRSGPPSNDPSPAHAIHQSHSTPLPSLPSSPPRQSLTPSVGPTISATDMAMMLVTTPHGTAHPFFSSEPQQQQQQTRGANVNNSPFQRNHSPSGSWSGAMAGFDHYQTSSPSPRADPPNTIGMNSNSI
jgi:hypothetical protein